jgi:chitinase
MMNPIARRGVALAAASLVACASPGGVQASPVFSPYKDTSVDFEWNTNVIRTKVSGKAQDIGTDIRSRGASTVTLAFATGACGSETWTGAKGGDVAAANRGRLLAQGAKYILSTGGEGGTFTCASDAGMSTFIDRWNSANLVGVDFDIENGQSPSMIGDLVSRVKTAHAKYPSLRFSFTIGVEAVNDGASVAVSGLGRGRGANDPYNGLNKLGNEVMAAITSVLGWDGTAAHWPAYVTIDLMAMDYGDPPQKAFCVVAKGVCQMGQSALQAAYDQASAWNMPYSGIELTPMLGGNDTEDEKFGLADVDTVASFALSRGLAGVHDWSHDRDVPCAKGPAKDTCNSMGKKTARYGYLDRFVADGMN